VKNKRHLLTQRKQNGSTATNSKALLLELYKKRKEESLSISVMDKDAIMTCFLIMDSLTLRMVLKMSLLI
jgi:hypothetical protein